MSQVVSEVMDIHPPPKKKKETSPVKLQQKKSLKNRPSCCVLGGKKTQSPKRSRKKDLPSNQKKNPKMSISKSWIQKKPRKNPPEFFVVLSVFPTIFVSNSPRH